VKFGCRFIRNDTLKYTFLKAAIPWLVRQINRIIAAIKIIGIAQLITQIDLSFVFKKKMVIEGWIPYLKRKMHFCKIYLKTVDKIFFLDVMQTLIFYLQEWISAVSCLEGEWQSSNCLFRDDPSSEGAATVVIIKKHYTASLSIEL